MNYADVENFDLHDSTMFYDIIKSYNEYIKSSHWLVISVGKQMFREIREHIDHGEFELPAKVIISVDAPKEKLLNKSSIYISSCRANSFIDSFKHEIPLICLDLNESNGTYIDRFGLKLNINEISTDVFYEAINKVLSDKTYLEKTKKIRETTN